jgi:hypothetical protein
MRPRRATAPSRFGRPVRARRSETPKHDGHWPRNGHRSCRRWRGSGSSWMLQKRREIEGIPPGGVCNSTIPARGMQGCSARWHACERSADWYPPPCCLAEAGFPAYAPYVTRPSSRRSIGSALIVVLFHLAVVTSGVGCGIAMHGSTAMGLMEMGAMADTPTRTSAHGAVVVTAPIPKNVPCRLPWAPDGCQTMAQCAPAAMQCAVVSYSEPTIAPDGSRMVNVAAPESLTRAPEPPPPRA